MKVLIGLDRGMRIIRWQTRGKYGHAKLLFVSADETPFVIEACFGWPWESGAQKGVILRRAEPDGKERATAWFAIPSMTPDGTEAAWRFAAAQVGKPYDLTMVLRFLSRRQESRKSRGKWFCSELAFAAIAKGGVALFQGTEPWEVAPDWIRRSSLAQACASPWAI